MKDHTSHDVLLLCPRCHQISNMQDLRMREKLAVECDAPFSAKATNMKSIELPRLRYSMKVKCFKRNTNINSILSMSITEN